MKNGGIIIFDKKEMTCCFTGHRDIPEERFAWISRRIEHTITELVGRGVIYFGAGGALGFDTIAALAALKMKARHPQIKLILVLPCREQADRWRGEDRALYQAILRRADKITYVSEHYTRDCMLARNRYLVDHSRHCVCYLSQSGGGTAYTVAYAVKNGLEIVNLADRGKGTGAGC